MSAKDGKPCRKCGANEWYVCGKCVVCSRENGRRWKKANAEKEAAKSRKWAKDNPEKANARAKRWQKNNPEKVAASNRLWKKNNPEKVAAKNSRRRTQKTKAGGSFTGAEWKALVDHYGGRCLCCGCTDAKLTADHIIPVSMGGTSSIDNIQPLCGKCNSSKCDKIIDYRPGKGLGRWIQKKLFG